MDEKKDIHNPRQILDISNLKKSEEENKDKIEEYKKHEMSGKSKKGFESVPIDKKIDDLKMSLWLYFGVPYLKLDPKNESDFKLLQKWIPYVEGVMDTIQSRYCKDLSKLKAYSIDDRGILELIYMDGRKDHITLLIDSLHLGQEATKKAMIHEQNRISRESIRQKYETESYLGGDLLVVYEHAGEVLKQNTAATVAVGYVAKPVLMRISSITYRLYNGRTSSLKIDKASADAGTKEQVSKTVVSQLSLAGIAPDPLRGGFAPRSIVDIHKAQLDIMKMSYREFSMYVGEDAMRGVSKNDFELNRQKLVEQLNLFDSELQNSRKTTEQITREFKQKIMIQLRALHPQYIADVVKNNKLSIAKAAISMPLNVMMLGVFANKVHENSQDSMMLSASAGEAAMFELGSMFGHSIANKVLLGRGKAVLGFAFGMWSVGRGEKIAHAISLDKTMWKNSPEREDEDEKMGKGQGKSFTDHAITLGTVNDLLDDTNLPGTNIKKPRGDMRIPGMRGGMDIQGVDIKWAKIPIPYLGLSIPYPSSIGKDAYTSVPDVALYKHNIDFGTDARAYMSAAIGRDMAFWNDRVSEYQTWLMPQIRSIVGDFENGRGVFSTGNVQAKGEPGMALNDQKKALLRDRLRTLLGAPLMGALAALNGEKSMEGMSRASELVEFISDLEGKSLDPIERDKRIAWWTVQQTELLKITPSKLLLWKKDLTKNENVLIGEGNQLLENITDPRKRKFFEQIFQRIRDKKPMIQQSETDIEIIKARKDKKIIEERQTGVWVETELLGTRSKKYFQYQESLWFNEFLDSTNEIKNTDFISLGGKNPNFGDAFYEYLNKMVAFKRQEQFVNNLQSTGMATKWRN